VYPIAAAVTPAMVWQKSGADCIAASVPTGSLYSAGAEMPASMFVAGAVEIEP
jgi:uncharacterized membrane protein